MGLTLIALLVIATFWLTNKHIRIGVNMGVASVQDFKNQVDSQNLGITTALASINSKIAALKAQIAAGNVTPADQLALLDSVLTDTTTNNTAAQATDAAATP